MTAFLLAIGCFIGAWCSHLVIWRVRLPSSQLKALLFIFMLMWAAVFVASLASRWPIEAAVELAYFSLVYWSAALCYVITYSAMEGDSPTLSLTRHLHRRGEEGVSHEEIEEFFRQRPFVGARVKALVTDNVFIEEEGGYRLSPGSYVFFRVILGYRRIVFGPIKSGG